MYSFISKYENPNKFNEEIIKELRQKDDMIEYLVDVCNAQANTIPYITFDGYELEEDENKFSHKTKIPINYSRLSLITFHFTIKFKDEIEKVKMPIFIPKLINNYYFILNGNKYYAIYQNVDSSTYNTRDSVILKSLLMPIILKSDKKQIVDHNGEVFDTKIFQINLFKKKANILFYYFSEMGFDETLEYFGFDKSMILVKQEGKTPITVKDNELLFPINKTVSLKVSKKRFETDLLFKSFTACVLDMFNKKTQVGKRNEKDYWKTKLGGTFTKNINNQVAKADSVLLSFKRILDDRTKKNLRIPDENKEDIFALIKWMMQNFDNLLRKDNLSLINKRLRLSEYQINAFNRRMSTNTYRMLNSKTLSMTKLKSCFNIPPMTIINDLQTSELLRYNNAVNDLDLFTCALKTSNRGPASIGEGSKKTVSTAYRGVHISHLGRTSLNSLSAGDPGMSGTLSPFIKTDGLYYDTSEITSDNFDIIEDEENEN